MSCKIQTKFAIREMRVMEDTLKKMGFAYDKVEGKLVISRPHYPIEISENEISCDSMNSREIDNIKVEYAKTVAINGIEERGEMYQMEETENEITILVN